MKSYLLLTTFILLTISSFGQQLEKKIDLEVKEKSIEEILNLIAEQYDVSFSYLNNELPKKPISVSFRAVPLGDALDGILNDTQLSIMPHGEQIIIKRSGTVSVKQTPDATEETTPTDIAEIDRLNALTLAMRDSLVTRDSIITATVDSLIASQADVDVLAQTDPDTTNISRNEPSQMVFKRDSVPPQPASDQKVTITYIPGEKTLKNDSLGDLPAEVIKYRPYHFGIFYPFSTNGPDAGQYVNKFSMHLLAGYSRGLNGFELSSITNVARSHVRGIQLTGVANVSGDELTGAQLAGIVNSARGPVKGAQIGGISNVAHDNHTGLQLAGVSNVALGSVNGFQASGGVNMARGSTRFGQVSLGVNIADKVDGPQIAGLINIQRGYSNKGNGIQVAGFMNKGGVINGFQLAGFMNQAYRINGAQIGGFINKASKVRGMQLGIINIADSLDGVPIGLFSLVKRNGYFDLELFYADDFKANAVIKVGSRHFHNIFGFSYEVDNKKRWAYGYGFGSQWGDQVIRLNTDAIAYYVVEKEFPNGAFEDYQLNILSRFRFLLSMHVHNFGVFGGPVFNVMTSRNQDGSEEIGSDIAPDPFYNQTDSRGLNVKMWVGYNVGIRF